MNSCASANFFLRPIIVTLLTCAVFFFPQGLTPFRASCFDQSAIAANDGKRGGLQTTQADFNKSEMRCTSGKVPERGTIRYEMILRNTGESTPDRVALTFHISPSFVMLAGRSPEIFCDIENHTLHWKGRIRSQEERSFFIELVTLPNTAGSIIHSQAGVAWGNENKSLAMETKVTSRELPEGILLTVGKVGLGPLEITILGYLLLVPLFLFIVPRLIRWREKKRAHLSPHVSWSDPDPRGFMVYAMSIPFLACIPVLFFLAFLVMDDVRQFSAYEKTNCIIVDKKLSWSTGSTGKTKSRIYDPLVSVRYKAGSNEIVSAGSMVKGTFSGRESAAEKKIAQYELGRSYPCWFDPEDPHEFLLERGLSWGWYLLCLGPVILLGIATRYLYRRLRGMRAPSEMSKAPIQPG